jgi:hypothetical protein
MIQVNSSKNFIWYWKRSFAAHAVLIILLVVATKFNFFSDRFDKPKIILPSVRVDIVELPKYTIEELKKLEIAPPPVSPKVDAKQKASESTDLPKETKQTVSDFEEIVKKSERNLADKTISDLKKLKEQKEIENRRDEMKELLLAGNKVQQGTLLQGEEVQQQITEFEQYILEVTEKVRYHWKLPSYLQNTELKCRIQLFINSRGMVEMTKIIESSGNEEYDSWAIRSIQDAIPFREPGATVLPELLRGKFVLGYPL